MAVVYVLSKDGKPLDVTTHCGHVRILLKTGKAKVVNKVPFTIRLLYDVEHPDVTREYVLGIDPGRTNIGIAAIRKDATPVFTAQVETRNKEIPKLMRNRKVNRVKHRKLKRRDKRRRRAVAAKTIKAPEFKRKLPGCEKPIVCHDIRNKEARFSNRIRPDGWLTPTANQLLQTHLNLVKKVQKILPVSKVVLELNEFAFMRLQNPGKELTSKDYENGLLKGYGSVNDAVNAAQEGKCLLCGKPIEHHHHIKPRSKGGSNTIGNIAGLCSGCHERVHKDSDAAKELKVQKKGLTRQFAGTSVLNQIIPALRKELQAMYGDSFSTTHGWETQKYRKEHQIPKDHYLDACCIACSAIKDTGTPITWSCGICHIRQYRRHDRECCHKEMLDRKYLSGKETVAVNRHKSADQKTDSLEEYRKVHTEKEISRFTVKPHPPQYKDRNRYLPGSMFVDGKKTYILQRTDGKHNNVPDYFVDTNGNKHAAKKCRFVHSNTGLVFVTT